MKKIFLLFVMILLVACSNEEKEKRIQENALAECLISGTPQEKCLVEYKERLEVERLKEENRLLKQKNSYLNNQQPVVIQQRDSSSEIISNIGSAAVGYVLGSQSNQSTNKNKTSKPSYILSPQVEKKFSSNTSKSTSISKSEPVKSTFKPIQVVKPKSTFKPIQVVKPKSSFKPVKKKK